MSRTALLPMTSRPIASLSFSFLLPSLVLLTALPAQTGRSMRLQAPVVVGATARFELRHPVAASGNLYFFLWSSPPLVGTQPVSVPGFVVQGLARVDAATAQAAWWGQLDGSGRVAHDLALANSSHLLGFAFDVQSLDLAVASSTLAFADDDLTLVVAGQPPAGLVPIAPGTFQMGGTQSATEAPVHTVTISRPFWIGQREVTQAEYQAVMNSNPSIFVGPSRPVEVSWNQATAYCNALNARETAAGRVPSGYRYRLPSEAEWEYVCRAGTTTAYGIGTSITCATANIYDYSIPGFCFPHPTEAGQTTVVGSYPANAWGVQDMHGNVAEWCLDRWPGPIASYPATPVVDPVENNPLYVYRILRGGNWYLDAGAARSASRSGNLASAGAHLFGFRVVLGPIL
jgi:formylglycine-generating enzyme required for sulfatase activity